MRRITLGYPTPLKSWTMELYATFIFITLGIDARHSLYSEQGSKAQHSNLNTEFRFGSCNIGPIRIPGHFILPLFINTFILIIH